MPLRKLTALSLYTTLSLVIYLAESLLPPPVPIPGIKLGLANLAVLFMLHQYSFKEAAFVSFVRILVIGFLFGNMFSIVYFIS